MANGSTCNRNPAGADRTPNHTVDPGCDDFFMLSPLYDVFDQQLVFPHLERSSSYDLDPYPYEPANTASDYPDPVMLLQASLKRQRSQTGDNLEVNAFFNHASNVAGNVPKKKQMTSIPRPRIDVPEKGIGPIYVPNVNDVLSGRGGRVNAHAGNVQFREIVAERKNAYLSKKTKKLEKVHIAADIVYYIRDMTPPGRFLNQDADGFWWDIGDARAFKKVGQALREDGPDIRVHEIEGKGEDTKVTSKRSTSAPIKKDSKPALAPCSPTEFTPTQAQHMMTLVTPTGSSSGMPVSPYITSGFRSGSFQSGIAVSNRGRKSMHCNIGSCSSVRSGNYYETYPTVLATPQLKPRGFLRGITAPPYVGGAAVLDAAACGGEKQQQLHPLTESTPYSVNRAR
jgi:hypothetical protein